ncbi:MAG: class I SAM-dependent methyltransferase [Oceanidesulfovibrio sp.]
MDKPSSDYNAIDDLMMHSLASHALILSTSIGLFDALESGPVPALDLALIFGFQEPQTEALLDLLAAHGLVQKLPEGYSNTCTASEYLVRDAPFFMGKAMELQAEFHRSITSQFQDLLRGHANSRQASDDSWATRCAMDGTEHYARLGVLQDTVEFVSALPGFSRMRTMCDIGGNHGAFSMALLDRNRELRAELVDLPHVAAECTRRIDECGYSDRMSAFGCDLRKDTLPVDAYDLALASHVLYAFMEELEQFLATVHAALRPGGWFVAQHMNPGGGVSERSRYGLQFVTRMAGYATHYIAREQLEGPLLNVGFHNIRTAPAGPGERGLIVAGQRA